MFDWLQDLTDRIVFDFFRMQPGNHFTDTVNFFIYDSIKILLLLIVIIFLMGIVNSYFPVERVRNFLSKKKLFGFEYLMASLFGVVTPFYSCSSVPLFIGFVRGGIPLGVPFSFLVTSPLVNEVAIGLFIGLFGLKTTIMYVVSGVLLGTVSGLILSKFYLEQYLPYRCIPMPQEFCLLFRYLYPKGGSGNRYCIYDGCGRIILAGSDVIEKSNDLKIDRYFLWCGNFVYYNFGIYF